MNPGPPGATSEIVTMTLVTQNCRGIADERKLKHLMNNCYKIGRTTTDYIIALQETLITDDHKLKYGWRGTHIFTPGSGHGRGCITLLPNHIQPDPNTITHLGQRGHIFKATINQNSAVVANLYAPTGQSREKIDFFNKVKEQIEALRDPTDSVYLMGDLNTVFEAHEVHQRSYSTLEQRHSAQVKQIIDSLALDDIWQYNRTAHTWRQTGTKKSSHLDRIYFQHNLIRKETTVDWAFTNSDHGAIIATFTNPRTTKAPKQLRLNPELLKSSTLKSAFLTEYRYQIEQSPQHWNPHQLLEFHKCAMRNAYLKISAENRKSQKLEYDFVKEDLHSHINALENCRNDVAKANRLMDRINQLKAKISKLNLEKGESLANKLKTKWYNEGERSNKYFLSLLRKKELNGQLTELEDGNKIIKDEKEIEQHVTKFYEELYNQPQHQTTAEQKNELMQHMERLNDNEIKNISDPITNEQLWQTLKNTQDSCPGPDGIPYSYIRATWDWFGPVLLKAWEYSLQTKKLAESHKLSWLRLIPKTGKNPRELKNWRPITLSNCDHKLITKTISGKMTENISRIISGSQTAYLKNRSISDNLRLAVLANKLAKKDTSMKGVLIALDAKKAFDSVNHQYIRDVLAKIGLAEMVHTFDLLYSESRVDILINNKLCKGYGIGNGVKQGDALSCTLFILAMEPLLRNIEANQDIECLHSRKYGVQFPKCIGYADDINILTTSATICVKAAIKEYDKFTNISGLQLNADKTEIFSLSQVYAARNYRFTYCGEEIIVSNQSEIKVNGIQLATDPAETHKRNFESVKSKMNKQFAAWANRGLSILGKILIYKTFGLSQITYTARVINFTEKEHKELRNLVYKFIWNRNYQLPKAPDRIKRTIMETKIKKGGFGMVDHEKITKAMNTRQVIVNLNGTHPIKHILEKIITNLDSHFNCKMKDGLDDPGENYCEVITHINKKLLTKELEYLQQDRIAQDMMLKEKLKVAARADRQHGLEIAILRHQGKTTVRQLLTDPVMTNRYRMSVLHYSYATLMDACITSITQAPIHETYIPIKNRYKIASKVTSRELRNEADSDHSDINFKFPTALENIEQLLPKINKIRCVKTKSFALRLIHGDIYTGTKLYRYGLKPDDECSKCRNSETLEHLLIGCWYPGTIWGKIKALYKATDHRKQTYDILSLNFAIGCNLSHPKLKLHLEIIKRLSHKDRPSVLPKMLIGQTLDYLIMCDKEHFKYYKKLKSALQTNT